MKKRILYIFLTILITGCVHENKKELSNNKQAEIEIPFIGEWESIERFYPYRSYLIIKNDSTFHFEYGACTSSGFSNGKWMLKDSTIVLNSYKIDSCLRLSQFEQDCVLIDDNDTTEYVVESTIPGCSPEYETEYIEFNNEEFILHNDTLKHIVKESKLCPDIRNDFFRIIIDTSNN